ncbi:hypothetical protein N656DRAFT_69637 [Canariomyces notabilis]|uniref:Uncharacterized protein n=1 Tax=Canariomyces notabilis TaxID=2074819 RepID=A0AAN6YXN0_9PEZI|nr:hypothetical protein N656DRAFT_69637 [Canariomyces arenarius]
MQSPAHEHRCYYGKVYQALASLQRRSRNCPAASSEDCRHLLQLLACLKPQPVPGDLFYRTFYPFRLWNEDGNESVGHIFNFPSIFETERRLQKTIQDAINAGALHVTTTSSVVSRNGLWWACRCFTLSSPSQVFIRNDMASTEAMDGAGTIPPASPGGPFLYASLIDIFLRGYEAITRLQIS